MRRLTKKWRQKGKPEMNHRAEETQRKKIKAKSAKERRREGFYHGLQDNTDGKQKRFTAECTEEREGAEKFGKKMEAKT